jgi:hypothetical protein
MGVSQKNRPEQSMVTTDLMPLDLLYQQDETAWLEMMSSLAAEGRLAEMDYRNLAEYLADMANRDRREVLSRLVVLLTHFLKWDHPPKQRSGSWKGTIREQRRELRQLLESRTLRNHAEAVLSDAYAEAREQAAAETLLELGVFPVANPWNLTEVMGEELS